MKRRYLPFSIGGLLLGALLCGGPPVLAQGYIDLEAEREREAAERERAERDNAEREAEREREQWEQRGTDPGFPRAAPGFPAPDYQTEPSGYPDAAPGYPNRPPGAPLPPGGARPPGGAPASMGDVYYQLQLLQREVMELRGRVEEQEYQIRQNRQQSLERYQNLDQRLSQSALGGAGAGAAGAGPDGGPGTGAPAPAAPVVRELPGEGDAYRAAYGLVRAREFPGAVAAFREFLLDFPSGHYAPNAHYWLGELYLVIEPQDLESSRREFKLLLDQYPDNVKTPDALYKLGKIHCEKGNLKRAREYLDRVVAEYGTSTSGRGSAAVKLARDFIKLLNAPRQRDEPEPCSQ